MTHATLYIGDTIDDVLEIPDSIRNEGVDVVHVVRDRLGIDDVRNIKEQVYTKPFEAVYKSFVIQCQSITNEAQNALLKIFEEPPSTSVFHLIVPVEDLLLPTLRSRLQIIHREKRYTSKIGPELRQFVDSTYSERIEQIQYRHKKKDTIWFNKIALDIEHYLDELPASKERVSLLKFVVFFRKYFSLQGSSKKMLFEEFALLLPARVKK